jgi:hypothetical protein
MNASEYQAPASVSRVQSGGLAVGGIGLVLAVIGAVTSPEKFYHSYLFSYMLVLGLTLGSLGLLMLQHVTGGRWGIIIRRPLEAASRNIWLVLLMFIPILFGMKYLYSGNANELGWLNSPKAGEGALSPLQQRYLTPTWFTVRAVLYFAVWIGLMWLFNKWSKEQDKAQDDSLRNRMRAVGAPGVILYILAMTFAAIDWVMSLSPHWASTIYGFLFVAGQAIAAMSLMIVVVVMLSKSEPFSRVFSKDRLHDLAKLLFAFNMLWAYFDFSQLLIIWSGNQPEEIAFYRTRLYGGWGIVAVVVLILGFALPFLILLSRDVKRNSGLISKIAIWMIFMRLVDLYWMTRPEFTGLTRATPTWLDVVVPVALIGLWVGFFAMNLKQRPLLPLGDPHLAEAIAQHEH